jgi:nitrogen fixation NifU-like protein
MYSEKVMDCFLHPKFHKKIKEFNGLGKVGNAQCGDIMEVYIYVKNNKIKDISFSTYGCVAAIATSDTLCKLAKGKTIEEALKITKQDVADELGGLPAVKFHCSVLATEALVEAVYDYYTKNKVKIPADLEKRHKLILKENDLAEKKRKNTC